jgi:hypothetical protein
MHQAPRPWALILSSRSPATPIAIGSPIPAGRMTDAAAGVHRRAWRRGGVAGSGAGAAIGNTGDWAITASEPSEPIAKSAPGPHSSRGSRKPATSRGATLRSSIAGSQAATRSPARCAARSDRTVPRRARASGQYGNRACSQGSDPNYSHRLSDRGESSPWRHAEQYRPSIRIAPFTEPAASRSMEPTATTGIAWLAPTSVGFSRCYGAAAGSIYPSLH